MNQYQNGLCKLCMTLLVKDVELDHLMNLMALLMSVSYSFRPFLSQVCSVDHRNFPLKRSELRLQETLHPIFDRKIERTAGRNSWQEQLYNWKELQITHTLILSITFLSFLSRKKKKLMLFEDSLLHGMNVRIIVYRRWTLV